MSGGNVNFTIRKELWLVASIGLALGVLPAKSLAQEESRFENRFRLTSTTFANDTSMPISTIHNIPVNNTNSCSIDGSPGGNQSPELSWTDAPRRTWTYVVTAYDVTAAFTHWGMYNIPANLTELPLGAGAPGGQYGTQIVNDFFGSVAEYDGPCPPANKEPYVHDYVFTVYALDIELKLPGSANFPAAAETLYQALIEAGKTHHILATATLTGLYSTTPPAI
jgi:Raf kinase inhibitor-like YbhB/YbcL family protein